MKLTFARHGQTDSNAVKIFNLKTESLNQKGEAQALELAKRLKEESFDLVLCSPLLRTKQTLTPILIGRDTPVEYWDELVEVDWGRFAGKPDVPGQEAFHGIKQGLFAESTKDLELRAKAFWNRIINKESKSVLIISHGAILCLLFAVHKGLKVEQFENFRFNEWEYMDNCSVKKLIL